MNEALTLLKARLDHLRRRLRDIRNIGGRMMGSDEALKDLRQVMFSQIESEIDFTEGLIALLEKVETPNIEKLQQQLDRLQNVLVKEGVVPKWKLATDLPRDLL